MSNKKFARFAWGVLCLNLGVILWGAFVRATGSGAGCGSHWPLCNGEVVPRGAEIQTLIELTHRATSGLALIAVFGMLIWSRRAYPAGHAVRFGTALSALLIVVEALLGAGLVLFELVADDASWFRAGSMIAHLVNTFFLVAALTLTAWWAMGNPAVRLRGRSRAVRLIGLGVIGVLVVGATGAIAALGDTLFPSESLQEGLRQSFSHDSHPLIQLRKFHPFAAILLGAGLVGIGRSLVREQPEGPTRRLAISLAVVYGMQILAGVVNIILLAPVALQLVHLLLADLLWINFVLLSAAALSNRGTAGRETVENPSVATVRL